MKRAMLAAAFAWIAVPAAAQTTTGPCANQSMSTGCAAALQAMASASPQYGIAAAAGSAVPGVEGTRGLTLGIVPHTTASLRVSAAAARLPDLAHPDRSRSTTPVAVKLGTATRVFGGTAAGTGELELLLEAGVLSGGRTGALLGAGARVGLLRETFASPGVSLSGMFRHASRLRYGHVCTGLPGCLPTAAGQADFGVNDASARLTVGKRLGPVGLLAGGGWDLFATTHGSFTYQGSDGFEPTIGTVAADVHGSRWSAFADVSKSLLVGSAIAEVGWMGGGRAVAGYTPGANGYDPGRGTVFGSVALRFQL
jgi:hypothetical protein